MKHLKELRKEKKLLQKDVADALNVDRTTYVKWENGSNNPSNEMLIRIANFFGVSIDYLLDNETEQIVRTEAWNPDESFADPDDAISIMTRGMKRMSPEKRQMILDVAMRLFAADFDEEGNKREK